MWNIRSMVGGAWGVYSTWTGRIESNLTKIIVIRTLLSATFFLPIFMLFMEEKKVTKAEIFMLEGAFQVLLLFIEIPLGWLADRWGRKRFVVLGAVFAVAGYTVYAVGVNVWWFLAAELLLAVYYGCASNALRSLTTDTVAELQISERRKQNMIHKAFARQNWVSLGVMALCGLAGGHLAMNGLRVPFIVTVPCILLALAATFLLKEPTAEAHEKVRLLRACGDMVRRRELLAVGVCFAVLVALTSSIAWFSQPYQMELGFPRYFYGWVFCAILLAGSFTAACAGWIKRWCDDRVLILIMGLVVLACYGVLSFVLTPAGLLLIMLGRNAWSFLDPLFGNVTSALVPKGGRSTAFALQTACGRLVMIPLCFSQGFLIQAYQVNGAISIIGLVGAGLVAVAFLLLIFSWRRIPSGKRSVT